MKMTVLSLRIRVASLKRGERYGLIAGALGGRKHVWAVRRDMCLSGEHDGERGWLTAPREKPAKKARRLFWLALYFAKTMVSAAIWDSYEISETQPLSPNEPEQRGAFNVNVCLSAVAYVSAGRDWATDGEYSDGSMFRRTGRRTPCNSRTNTENEQAAVSFYAGDWAGTVAWWRDYSFVGAANGSIRGVKEVVKEKISVSICLVQPENSYLAAALFYETTSSLPGSKGILSSLNVRDGDVRG